MSYFNEVILKDRYGAYLQSDQMRNLKIAEPLRIVGAAFESVTDANFWTSTASLTLVTVGTGCDITVTYE